MRCEEFWDKWIEEMGSELSSELQTHLKKCKSCREEFAAIKEASLEIKKEIFDEEPASLWHDIRNNIHEQVKVPKKKRTFFNFSWKEIWILVPTLAAIALFTMFSLKNQPIISQEDLYLMAGGLPTSVTLIDNEIEQNGEEELEEDAIIGISDPMAALLIETS